ncbi:hypothetical protein RFI_24309, partial [Reticulomyxa filosa]
MLIIFFWLKKKKKVLLMNFFVKSESKKEIGKMEFKTLDLSKKQSIDEFVEWIVTKKKDCRVCVLINNAGLANFHAQQFHKVRYTNGGQQSFSQIEEMWLVNYIAPFYLTQQLLPTITSNTEACEFGRVIN